MFEHFKSGNNWRVLERFTKAQIFHTMKTQKALLRKRNSDHCRVLQQRFTKPQTAFYTKRAMYSISQHRQSGVQVYRPTPFYCRTMWKCQLGVKMNSEANKGQIYFVYKDNTFSEHYCKKKTEMCVFDALWRLVRRVLKRTTLLLSLNMETVITLTMLQLLRYEFLANVELQNISQFPSKMIRTVLYSPLSLHQLTTKSRPAMSWTVGLTYRERRKQWVRYRCLHLKPYIF